MQRKEGTTPVAVVDAPLRRRPLSNEKRHKVMRDGILASMKADETAARPLRACARHTRKTAALSTQPADYSWEYAIRRREWSTVVAVAADRRPA